MLFSFTFITLIFSPYFSLCFTGDEVIQMPGLSVQPKFRHYSGYLNASKGHYLHYWFVESQSNPSEDPVILWLTGGPGCSSLNGFWTENGPFRVDSNDDKTFNVTEDPNSWNSLANVLYLESPIGVGFSYADEENPYISDDSTAEDNYLALLNFFEKFPKFKNNSFYITGESYAGVYIPTLAVKIFRNQSDINLKGLAIGNGLFQYGFSSTEYAYSHGLIDSNEWNELISNCCTCTQSGQVCDFSHNCSLINEIQRKIFSTVLNQYNILSDCDPSVHSKDSQFHESPYVFDLKTNFGINFEEMYGSVRRQWQSDRPQCLSHAFIGYMNTHKLQEVINLPEQREWRLCSNKVNQLYHRQYRSLRSEVLELIERHKIQSIVIYNGDLDIVCDFMGDQQFVDSLGLKLKEKYTKWTVNERIAGFVKRYEGITFMTVRNAGHMVPTDQPEAALSIIKELIGVSKVNP